MAFEITAFRRGYDVDENAIRFSNYFHVLRELVHFSNGWLPLVGDFETKYRLGDHLHDDARAISKVRRRLYELRHPSEYPGAPGEELTALLERIGAAGDPREYIAIAYGEAKPMLIAAIQIHLDRLDPVSDEPSLRLLTQVLARQKRHRGLRGVHPESGKFARELSTASSLANPSPPASSRELCRPIRGAADRSQARAAPA